mmetsp:Transcript_16128/g.35776  ORF Transcript_16128/g.35776 Transcript_16128/m.35776 type:complete len:416 (+) Transcript_16128:1158-2405(+)
MSSVCSLYMEVVSSSCSRRSDASPLWRYFKSSSSACTRLSVLRSPAASLAFSVDSSCAESIPVFSEAFSRRRRRSSSSSWRNCSAFWELLRFISEEMLSRCPGGPCTSRNCCFNFSNISRWFMSVLRLPSNSAAGSSCCPWKSGKLCSCTVAGPLVSDRGRKALPKGAVLRNDEPSGWPSAPAGGLSPMRDKISDLSESSAVLPPKPMTPVRDFSKSLIRLSASSSTSSLATSALLRSSASCWFCARNSSNSEAVSIAAAPSEAAAVAARTVSWSRSFSCRKASISSHLGLSSASTLSCGAATTGAGSAGPCKRWRCVSSSCCRMASMASSFSCASRRAFRNSSCCSSSSRSLRIFSAANLFFRRPIFERQRQPRACRWMQRAARLLRATAFQTRKPRSAACNATVAAWRCLASL